MKIDYVVISSNDNALYKDFLPIISNKWNELGYKVLYLNITDEDSELNESEYGLIKKIKRIDNIDDGFQSQVVRIWSYSLLKNKNLLLSDIDMLPINGKYFSDNAENVTEDKVLIYSGQAYLKTPYYPTCYILGNSDLLSSVLEVDNEYSDFINKMKNYDNLSWVTDEKYMYDKLFNFENKIILNDRIIDSDQNKIPNTRIDRAKWGMMKIK